MLELLTIFLGAFLVFLVQPLIGNVLLPVFGGTAAVWSACLAAFQILLVVGYFYAYVTGRTGKGFRFRLGIHAVLLFAASGWLFYVASDYRGIIDSLTTSDSIPPAFGTLLCIGALVAGPYILFSSNSTLVQVLSGGKYKLYAISNLGSLLGLIAYPFVLEPFLPLSKQWFVFASVAAIYSVLFVLLLLHARCQTCDSETPTCMNRAVESDGRGMRRTYFLLSFISCYLLNAVSTHLCTDITPLPMLWAALLSVYLLSYVFAFTDRGSRWARWSALIVVPLALFGVWHFGVSGYTAFLPELAIGFSLLLLGGWIVHARLYRLRPPTDGLPQYYLMISLGGAAGGAACSFLMPCLCNTVAEYPIALALVLGVVVCDGRDALVAFARQPSSRAFVARSGDPQIKSLLAFVVALGETGRPARLARRVVLAILVVFAVYGIVRGRTAEGAVLCRYRNFYGLGSVVCKIMSVNGGMDYRANEFRSNGTIHGFQKVEGDWKSQVPTVYYAEHAGGLPILKHPARVERKPMRVALCGMGIGTLAAYAQEGDFYRFYEINPDVAKIARNERFFSFVPKASGTIDVVLDDARRALSREAAASEPLYDVIVADVFNGDAIPPHMATREAFRLYLDRLAPDGILAFHLSNWHLDLLPMVKAAAKEFELHLEALVCRPTLMAYVSTWAFLSRAPLPPLYDGNLHDRIDFVDVRDIPLMTDDFHSLMPYLRLATTSEKQKKE